MPSTVKITFNEFAKDGALEGLKASIVATMVRGHGEAVTNAAVDLGQMRNGMMWEKGWDSDAFNLPKEGGFNSQPDEKASESDKIKSDRGIEGVLGNGVEHTIHVEFGTKYMPAQPALRTVPDALMGATAEQIGKKWGRAAMDKEFIKRKKKGVK
ncbi:MAG: hypothetical protein PF693_10985 [Spirochaetia bacterium]|jgi:hypothetical protein|nr:hypothetical protein [Spirochaetia bacterium]